MTITYSINKNTGIKYAYEVTSAWSPKEKKTITRRQYLGRVNPSSGEIIPSSGVRGKKRKDEDPLTDYTAINRDYKLLYEEVVSEKDTLASELREARKHITALNKQLKEANAVINRFEKIIRQFKDSSTTPLDSN